MSELVSAAANKALGEGSACKMPAPTMGIEDIGYFCQKAPGCYYQLGIANADKGSIFPLHSPYFFVDLDAISCGAALYVQIAEDFLKSED